MLYDGVAQARAQYLVPFALRYGFGPGVVDGMSLSDFAVYSEGIDALAASPPPGMEG